MTPSQVDTPSKGVGKRMVALDLDGTLIDQAAAAREWSQIFIRTHHLPIAPEVMADALRQHRPKDEVFTELVTFYALPLTADQMWADYRRVMPHLVRVAEPDRQALAALRDAGWALGIITNGSVENQEGKIYQTGLHRLVDGWVVSERAGFRKPDPRLFQALAREIECPLEGWIIGDGFDADIQGGALVGLRTAWIAREDATHEPTPDIVAPSVAAAVMKILIRDAGE